MKLYHSPTSPFARKVRAVALEKGVAAAIEEIAVDPWTDPPALLAANPLGKVPALVTADGMALYDSRVICAYLDGLAPAPTLVPAAGADRLPVLGAEALADGVMDAAVSLFVERRRPEGERSTGMMARWRAAMARGTTAMAAALPALPGTATLGHIAMAVSLGYLDFRHADLNWREGNRALAEWYEGFAGREAMAATAPPA